MKTAAKVYDVCVVGSGAAGGVVAMELSKRGASVALLEAGFGPDLKREIRETYPGLVLLDALNAMIPSPERYVELDPAVKDVYGLPAPKIHFSQTTEDLAMIRDAADRSAEIIEAAGGEVLQKARGGGHDSTHYVGTCKMGTDPKTSVLTPFCRTHDLKNLFVADGSCFVDYPEKNPTLTVMTIAARTADYIYEQLSRTPIRNPI
ncbi:MAG: GMC oxidoreductase [Blastocatellia bacterium]